MALQGAPGAPGVVIGGYTTPIQHRDKDDWLLACDAQLKLTDKQLIEFGNEAAGISEALESGTPCLRSFLLPADAHIKHESCAGDPTAAVRTLGYSNRRRRVTDSLPSGVAAQFRGALSPSARASATSRPATR